MNYLIPLKTFSIPLRGPEVRVWEPLA